MPYCTKVKSWIKDQPFQLLENWPASSPDLNTIENCWMRLKEKVAIHNPTSRDDLIRVIKEVWVKEITQEYCSFLISSMPRRINAVLANKGLHTKY